MLNLNYNIIGAANKEGFIFPNSASIDYVFTSSVFELGLETNTQLTVEVTSSQAPKRREYSTYGSLNGVPYKERFIAARPSSSVNVYYEGLGAWDFTNYPSGAIAPLVDYIVVGGGACGNLTDGGNNGGGGGNGGFIITGSFPIPFNQYQATMSLAIPQIGYVNTTASYSGFNAVTQSFLTASFTASANTKYDIYATSSINPFVYKVKVLQIGQGGQVIGAQLSPTPNANRYSGNIQATYQCSIISFLSIDNPNVSSSITTPAEIDAAPRPLLTSSGILYGVGGTGSIFATHATPGQNGLTWLNNEVYGSGGGGGASSFSAPPSLGGTNAGNGAGEGEVVPIDARANYGGGGGGGGWPGAFGSAGGLGGSGVAIFRYYDPSGSYTSTGGIRTVTGSYVYHTFITGGQDFNITVPSNNPY
jgi:hypothetical protein